MTAEDFLKELNPHSKVFDLSIEYEFTEEQLLLFARLYHESELKKLRLDAVSGQSELFNCGKERVFGEKKCDKQCDDCLKGYGSN